MSEEKRIVSFRDLEVYRSVKTVPRLIAEGYSKRHQKRGYQALIDDAMEESNETIGNSSALGSRRRVSLRATEGSEAIFKDCFVAVAPRNDTLTSRS